MASNLPPGLTEAHPHFNPEVCPECEAEGVTPGEDCPECDEYVMTDADYAEMAAEQRFDMMRDEGLI